MFIPFLEQHTELTPEDEKLLAEIMETEDDWFRVPEDKENDLAPIQPKQPTKDDLIGTQLTIDNRRNRLESEGEISGDVSMRDITFQNEAGFPVNRVEKISYIRRLLEQAQPQEEWMRQAKDLIDAFVRSLSR